MKSPFLLACASALALGAVGCAPKAEAPRAALDCPANEGGLTRTAQAADGKSCTYQTADGAEVTLQLMPVSGSAGATLDRLEATLLAEASPPARPADAAPAPSSAGDAARAAGEAAKDASAAAKDNDNKVKVDVDVKIDEDGAIVSEEGSVTRVNLPGIHIEADEAGDTAKVKVGPITIDAGEDGAVVKMRRDVRMKGEALAREKRGVRATFLAGGKDSGQFVGYEAGGPKTGPLTVAIVRSKESIEHGGDLREDVGRLVRRNGGV